MYSNIVIKLMTQFPELSDDEINTKALRILEMSVKATKRPSPKKELAAVEIVEINE